VEAPAEYPHQLGALPDSTVGSLDSGVTHRIPNVTTLDRWDTEQMGRDMLEGPDGYFYYLWGSGVNRIGFVK